MPYLLYLLHSTCILRCFVFPFSPADVIHDRPILVQEILLRADVTSPAGCNITLSPRLGRLSISDVIIEASKGTEPATCTRKEVFKSGSYRAPALLFRTAHRNLLKPSTLPAFVIACLHRRHRRQCRQLHTANRNPLTLLQFRMFRTIRSFLRNLSSIPLAWAFSTRSVRLH